MTRRRSYSRLTVASASSRRRLFGPGKTTFKLKFKSFGRKTKIPFQKVGKAFKKKSGHQDETLAPLAGNPLMSPQPQHRAETITLHDGSEYVCAAVPVLLRQTTEEDKMQMATYNAAADGHPNPLHSHPIISGPGAKEKAAVDKKRAEMEAKKNKMERNLKMRKEREKLQTEEEALARGVSYEAQAKDTNAVGASKNIGDDFTEHKKQLNASKSAGAAHSFGKLRSRDTLIAERRRNEQQEKGERGKVQKTEKAELSDQSAIQDKEYKEQLQQKQLETGDIQRMIDEKLQQEKTVYEKMKQAKKAGSQGQSGRKGKGKENENLQNYEDYAETEFYDSDEDDDGSFHPRRASMACLTPSATIAFDMTGAHRSSSPNENSTTSPPKADLKAQRPRALSVEDARPSGPLRTATQRKRNRNAMVMQGDDGQMGLLMQAKDGSRLWSGPKWQLVAADIGGTTTKVAAHQVGPSGAHQLLTSAQTVSYVGENSGPRFRGRDDFSFIRGDDKNLQGTRRQVKASSSLPAPGPSDEQSQLSRLPLYREVSRFSVSDDEEEDEEDDESTIRPTSIGRPVVAGGRSTGLSRALFLGPVHSRGISQVDIHDLAQHDCAGRGGAQNSRARGQRMSRGHQVPCRALPVLAFRGRGVGLGAIRQTHTECVPLGPPPVTGASAGPGHRSSHGAGADGI